MAYRYALAQHGSTLATRPFAEELRRKLVGDAAGCELLELDFAEILSASSSFADELVACLAQEAKEGKIDFNIAISGASPEVESVVIRALDRREVQLHQLS